MVPSGSPAGQSVQPSLLRSNSVILGAQSGGSSVPSESGFPSLSSPRTHYQNTGMLGEMPHASSFLSHSFVNGSSGGQQQRGSIDTGVESDPLSTSTNCSAFNSPSFIQSNLGASYSHPHHNNQILVNQQQQLDSQNFHQKQHLHSIRTGTSNAVPMKLEPQASNDQQQQQQLLQSLRNFPPLKLEAQQMQATMRGGLGPVKIESQHSDAAGLYFQQQQQQQQQYMHMSRQSSQAAAAAQMNLIHQQRFLQMQQQHQLLKTMPQQRSHLTDQQQQQQQQNLPLRSLSRPQYEPGMCSRRIAHYMSHQQKRPDDNSIEFWRKFVSDYFAPNAKKKWCVSQYGTGRQTTGVVPQDVWHCEICNRKPGRGFEATIEVLPRLFKIKYESGTLEELLSVDMPREYQIACGQVVLDYAKATQASVFEQFRVVREGQLRIVFSLDMKICSWEFCAKRHEELIPRRLLMPQVSQLAAAAQKYQTAVQNAASSLSVPDLQNNCNMFVASARQLAKALEVPLVNDLGYTKRYVRCLQISEVVNSMKDLIDYSRSTSVGPIESLAKFPRRTGGATGFAQQVPVQVQVPDHHHHHGQANVVSPYSGIQMASPGSSSTVAPPSQPNCEAPDDSQSSVQKIIQEMMMSSQHADTAKAVSNGNAAGAGGGAAANGMRGAAAAVMGREGRASHQSPPLPPPPPAQVEIGNPLLRNFTNMPFDWKSSP